MKSSEKNLLRSAFKHFQLTLIDSLDKEFWLRAYNSISKAYKYTEYFELETSVSAAVFS